MNLLTASLAVLLFLPQEVYGPADFVQAAGNTFQARFDGALTQGRAGNTDTFWVAYQMPVRANRSVTSPDGIEFVNTNQPERVGLFLLVRRSDGAIDKIRTVNLSQEVQRKNDESIPSLERIAKEHPNTAVRKQAIFWLGQKRDPRVLDFFEQLLKK